LSEKAFILDLIFYEELTLLDFIVFTRNHQLLNVNVRTMKDTFLILTFIILILSMKVRIQLINYSTVLYILQHMLRKYLTVGSKSQ
jgi:hypothetical protein